MNSLEKIVHFTKKFLDTSLLAGAMTLSAFVGCKQDHHNSPVHEEPPPEDVEPLKMPKGYGTIAFILNGEKEVWRAAPDGSELGRLVGKVAYLNERIRFSPDGKYLAFQEEDEFSIGRNKIKILNPKGEIVKELKFYQLANFNWFPDGSGLIIGGEDNGIYRYDLQSSNLEKLCETVPYNKEVLVSPDLKKVIFINVIERNLEKIYSIYRVDVSGGNAELIGDGGIANDIFIFGEGRFDTHWLDGKHLIFGVNTGKNTLFRNRKDKLRYFDIETREIKEIDPGISFSFTNLSPDKNTLAIFGENETYLTDVSQFPSSFKLMRTIPEFGIERVSWSPDSKFLLISDGCCSLQDLKIFDNDGNNYQFLQGKEFPYNISSSIGDIEWSHIDPPELPKEPEPVTHILPRSYGKIAFTSENNLGHFDLWTINPDGSEQRKISEKASYFSRVKFSPDGKYLAFNETDPLDCKILDNEGKTLVEVSNADDFSWTPDSKSILFGRYFDGIYRYDLFGGGIQKLFNSGKTADHDPKMSPNLEKIVFAHHQFETEYFVYTVNSNGGDFRKFDSGRTLNRDESIDFEWINDDRFIYKIRTHDFIYHINIKTGEKNGAPLYPDFDIDFPSASLSTNKEILAIFGDPFVSLINMNEFLSGSKSVNEITSQWVKHIAWSKDSRYFVSVGGLGVKDSYVKVFDVNGNEYQSLLSTNFFENGAKPQDVDWSHE